VLVLARSAAASQPSTPTSTARCSTCPRFHDWDEDPCRKLARLAFEALEPGGLILLHEEPLDDTKDGPLAVGCFSVVMLLNERVVGIGRADQRNRRRRRERRVPAGPRTGMVTTLVSV
jgi:hypothetical protein